MSVITHNILTACVKISVEGVVGTLVSTPSRHLEEDSPLKEMIISENSPALDDADYLLDQGLL